jgi:hypothetical protein
MLENRTVPSTLTLPSAGNLSYTATASYNLTLSYNGTNYVVNDTTQTITTTISGWTGSGTHTVSGPVAGSSVTFRTPIDFTGVLNLRNTPSGTTFVVFGEVADTVNVGDSNGVQDILGPVILTNPLNFTTAVVDDSADTTARTATVVSSSGYDTITGLAPATISTVDGDIQSLTGCDLAGAPVSRVFGSALWPVFSGGRLRFLA